MWSKIVGFYIEKQPIFDHIAFCAEVSLDDARYYIFAKHI